MKRKHLLFLSSAFVLMAGAMLISPNQENNYQPRKSYAPVEDYYGAAEYYHFLRANPATGEFDKQLYNAVQKSAFAYNANKNNSALALTWDEVGPDNIGGRTRAILSISNDLMFAGSVSGGLFKSTTHGNTWERVPGFNQNYSISTMAVLGNGNIYIGTGNTHELVSGVGSSGSIGGGLFVSTDNGVTWDYAKDENDNPIKPSAINPNAEFSFITKIVADPNQDNKLWVAYDGALKPYVEGQGFGSVPEGLPESRCEDVDISSDGNVITASVGGFASSNAYVSVNGGDTFSKVSGSGDDQIPENLVRIEFAISPDDANYLYAAVAAEGRIGKFDGIYSSTDKGTTWSKIWNVNDDGSNDPDIGQQAYYDLALTVVPGDKNLVLLGALTIWASGNESIPQQRTVASGFTPGIGFIPSFYTPGFDFTAVPILVHADVHVFEWDQNGTLFVGTDGGIFRSEDNGNTYTHSNRFYNVTQYYGVGYSANDKVVGGAQDNGTTYITGDRNTPQEAYSVGGGDGFDCEISSLDPDGNVLFTSSQGNFVRRSDDAGFGGQIFIDPSMFSFAAPFHSQIRLWETKRDFDSPNTSKFTNATGDVLPAGTEVEYPSKSLGLILTTTLEEDLPKDSAVLLQDPVSSLFAVGYSGNDGVWVTRGALILQVAAEWAQVADSINGVVFSQEWSKIDGNYLFFGTSTGYVYRVSGFADAYDLNELSVDSAQYALTVDVIYISPDGAPIIDISIDPNDDDHLIVAKSGFGGTDKVIETKDATADSPSFSNIWFTSGEMAQMPAYSVLIDATDGNSMLVGTEFGIYSTSDAGANWGFEGDDPMGAFQIFDIRQQWHSPEDVENAGYIYVGSHGRGAFKSSSLQKHGFADVEDPKVDELVDHLLIAPNPMSSYGILEFNSDIEGVVDMDIYSMNGQKVKSIKFVMNLGANSYQFDVSDLNRGTYIIKLNKDNKVTTKKFIIIK